MRVLCIEPVLVTKALIWLVNKAGENSPMLDNINLPRESYPYEVSLLLVSQAVDVYICHGLHDIDVPLQIKSNRKSES